MNTSAKLMTKQSKQTYIVADFRSQLVDLAAQLVVFQT